MGMELEERSGEREGGKGEKAETTTTSFAKRSEGRKERGAATQREANQPPFIPTDRGERECQRERERERA